MPRREAARGVVAATIAALLFYGSWKAIHHGWYGHGQLVDTPRYEAYGEAIERGAVPYRDVSIEYPPGALPAFLLPALGSPDRDFRAYRAHFERLMLLCGALLAAFVAIGLVGAGATGPRLALGVGLIGLFPLALGNVLLSRFDLWPALLTAAALAAVLWGFELTGCVLLAVAVTAKLYPLVLLPLLILWTWRRRGQRRAAAGLATFVAALAAILAPFLWISPGGVAHSVWSQVSRPLQLESLGSSVLVVLHHLGLLEAHVVATSLSSDLAAPGARPLEAVQTAALAAVLTAVYLRFARGPAEADRLVLAAAASLTAFVALSKVLSPQFLVWLVPVLALLPGRRGLLAAGLLVAALVLTQVEFPYRYPDLLDLGLTPSLVLFARNLVLLGVLAVLLWPQRTGTSLSPARVPATRQ